MTCILDLILSDSSYLLLGSEKTITNVLNVFLKYQTIEHYCKNNSELWEYPISYELSKIPDYLFVKIKMFTL